MKRILLLMLSVIVSTMMMADDVTPQQALEQASQFVKSRKARGGGPRLAPGTQLKLTLASRVSDLYVFNINDDAGYVIVSNDDVAVPILGYSDSGSFDPNNIPDNMRAWLQGYADEIAWAKANHVTKPANAPMKAALGGNITPLVETRWDQGVPYNNLCPNFFTYGKSVTGCVATAMAQVMYYTATHSGNKPAQTLVTMPAYQCDRNWSGLGQISVDEVPAGTTLDWANMLTSYAGSYSSTNATAVATLMKACGASVEMDYSTGLNGGSSAAISDVDWALKSYFGYSSETTQHLSRDAYSDENWEKIIYHELESGRPVVYGGQAYKIEGEIPNPNKSAGHAFVCDGYKYVTEIENEVEIGKNYFHINWGWGGTSDDYFLLSALEPTDQGYGGSGAGYTGFNYMQEAVIGIQLKGATGTVAPEVSQATGISLQVLSVETNKNLTLTEEEMKVHIRVKNNSTTNYDGMYAVWERSVTSGYAYNYQLVAGESGEFNVSINVPNKPGTYRFNVLFRTEDSYLHTMGVTLPVTVYPTSVSGSMNAYGWATFSSEYPLDFNNVEGDGVEAAYIVSGFSGNAVAKTEVTMVPKNTGLLLKGTPNAAYTIPVTLAETDDVSTNKLVAVATETVVSEAEEGSTNYVLSVQNDKVVFASIHGDAATVPAGRAYLTLTETSPAPWLAIEGDGDATGILNMNRETTTNNVYYDLQGRRVEHPTKGVYVVNGKKVVIK